jgi:hypothetical protein
MIKYKLTTSKEDLCSERFIQLETQFKEFRLDIERRLRDLNQLREDVIVDRNQFMTRDLYDAQNRELNKAIDEFKQWKSETSVNLANHSNLITAAIASNTSTTVRVGGLESWQSWLMGIGIVLVTISGIVGAALSHSFFK